MIEKITSKSNSTEDFVYYWLGLIIFWSVVFYAIYMAARDFYVFVIGWIFMKKRLKKFGKWACK